MKEVDRFCEEKLITSRILSLKTPFFLPVANPKPVRRNGFTFSSSGTPAYIAKVDVAAWHDGRTSVSELIRRALRLYVALSGNFPEEFKKDFKAIDLQQQTAASARRNRFSAERKRLELEELEALDREEAHAELMQT